jgi:hypothetical protein
MRGFLSCATVQHTSIELNQAPVIASEAKQSSAAARSGLLRRFAPRNDASAIVLAMRPASEFCGKRHGKGTEQLPSSDRGLKPAVESGLSSRSSPPSQERKKKEGGETPTDA